MSILVIILLGIMYIFEAFCRENVAYKKDSRQSTTFQDTLLAKYANDGVLDQDILGGQTYCSHTNLNEPEYWWAVDLGASYDIGSITIYNRKGDLEIHRLSNYSVIVYDPAVPEWTSFSAQPGVLCYFHAGQSPLILNLACTTKTKGRYVKIHKTYSPNTNGDTLTLCEVQVFVGTTNNVSKFCNDERKRPLLKISTKEKTSKIQCSTLCNQRNDCIGFQSTPGVTCDLYQTSITVDTADSNIHFYEKC